VTPPAGLADKGRDVEEWVDLRFFRPAGLAVVRALDDTRVTPDHVTVAGLLLGLVAGHLFFYRNPVVNAAGLVLFILSDVLDSADGQLARRRGTSTPFGRMLDGVADNLRFINLYAHLMARLALAGGGWPVILLGAAAGLAHSYQSAAADFIRLSWLWATEGRLPDLPAHDRPERRTLMTALYAGYLRKQAGLFPATVSLMRAVGAAPSPALTQAWRSRLGDTVRRCAWIGQNIRWALLMTVILGWPTGFFWLTAVPLTVVMLALVASQERTARAARATAPEPVGHRAFHVA